MFNKVCYILIGGIIIANVYVARAADFKIDTFREEPIKNEVLVRTEKIEEPSMKEWVLMEVRKNGLDPKYVEKLIECESRWDDKAVSSTGDKGLWQINQIHKLNDECRLDYKCSTEWSIKKIIRDNGFGAWVCSKLI